MTALDTARNAVLARAWSGRAPSGAKLPPHRYRMGGAHFQDNGAFVAAARADVQKLVDEGLASSGSLLDWGCGAGRLAVGVREVWPDFAGRYLGLDVQAHLVDWDRRNLAGGNFAFEFVDVANARYNSAGRTTASIPAPSDSFDALYGYSVLSHMTGADTGAYLVEIARVLRGDGFAWISAFVEDDVPEETENPSGYGPLEWSGPLHCVRFSTGFFASLVAQAGLTWSERGHGTETDGQTAIVLRHAS